MSAPAPVRDRGSDRRSLVLFAVLVGLIDGAAYLGALPTWLRHLPGADTAAHFLLLGLLGLLTHRALGRRSLASGVPVGPVLIAGLASLGEAAQAFAPQRSVSGLDALANLLGIAGFYAADAWLSASGRVRAWRSGARP